MSRFTDALAQADPPPRPGQKCFTCAWFEENPEERDDVVAAWESVPCPQMPSYAHLWRLLSATFDLNFTESAFGNHFRNGHHHRVETPS